MAQHTIPDGYKVVRVGGCNYLVHESEMPGQKPQPVAIKEVLEVMEAEGE